MDFAVIPHSVTTVTEIAGFIRSEYTCLALISLIAALSMFPSSF